MQQSAIWAYEDLSGGVPTYSNPYPNAIAAENSLPGTFYSNWLAVPASATSSHISGYTGSMSYDPGGIVDFKVFSENTGFNVEITRLGYYGYIAFGGRTVATVAGTPTVQPAPTVNSYGGTECAWTTTATWNIPSDATPGVYSYLLRRTDNTSYYMLGVFVVRSPVPSSKSGNIMLTTADFTWQAYNAWGSTGDSGEGYSGFTGRSLYGTAPSLADSNRAFAVSYDRPLGVVSNNAETFYWDSEGGLVSFLEGNGYDVSYYTMVDIEKDATIPSKFTTAVVSGHSEYWSGNVRDAFEGARDNGTNLMFFSSNTSLWHVRFDSADANKRTIICYKDTHNVTGYDGVTKYDPTSYTGSWRDSRTTPGGVNNTARRPESAMTGLWFIGNGTYADSVAVPNTYKDVPMWRNTAVAAGGAIALRATSTNVMTTAGTSSSITTPSATKAHDLILIAVVINGTSAGFNPNGIRIVYEQYSATTNLTTVLMQLYATADGAATYGFSWGNSLMASTVCAVYSGAVWEDSDSTLAVDTGGGATHTTTAATSGGAHRWAICVFADVDSTGSSKTTSWTAGSGLTSRVQANNSSAVSGSWTSIALMDTNGAVSQGAHQYSATAEFANPNAAAGMMYISPGTVLFQSTVGAEWDYVKREEPSTPKNMVMLSRQATQINSQRSDYYGDTYGGAGTFYYGMTLYKAPSGALVFNTGSWRFPWGISRFRNSDNAVNSSVDVNMQQALVNILKDFGHAPGTLLSATANNDVTALVDPGAAAAAASYGLDAAAPTDYKYLFNPSNIPLLGTSLFDNTDYTLATLFMADTDGKIYGARWYFPDLMPNLPVVATLFSWISNAAGTALASATFSNCQYGWNEVLFSSPVNITANTKYVIAVWTSDHYASTSGQFTSSSLVNGNLTAPQDTSGAHNGKFEPGIGSGPVYPTQTFNGGSYFADVLYVGDGSVSFSGWGISMS